MEIVPFVFLTTRDKYHLTEIGGVNCWVIAATDIYKKSMSRHGVTN
ncbi:hypothetical protein HanXRQr2_Chr06g0262981 [Helianthus annuus]|uniref:Uncharacterized protein n=1 Tax=Helianthus annuus TaxID=4232 RepID=A0A9K3NK97_HELAN|nr:hypothetical protein HanXRQr2_Chr06g0262981 [Helianthus annuus]